MKCLYDAGFTDISGHEIPAQEEQTSQYGNGTFYRDRDYSSVPSSHFDAVTLLDVAEHVPDPQGLFDACARVLRPGGLLYLHTPVVSRMDRIMHSVLRLPVLSRLGRIWQGGRTSIHHLENYTPRAMMLLLQRSGFHNIHIELKNELTWPIHRYVRVYLIENAALPEWLMPLFVCCLRPVLASSFLNANKAIVSATRAQ